MSADSFHHIVEERMKKVGDVCDFYDFIEIINFRGIAASLKANDSMYPKGVSTSKNTSGKPKLKHVSCRVLKGFWVEQRKLSFTSIFNAEDFATNNVFEHKQEPHGVTTSKKHDIINKLCPLMPESKRKFWNDLPCCDDSIDLADQRENSDYEYKD